MSDYCCPFCGEEVQKDEILFCYDKTPDFYEDRVRYEFLTSGYSQYHLENGAMFRGLYFRPEPEWIVDTDKNGYPVELIVRPCDGLAPQELLNTQDALDSEPVTKPADETKIPVLTRACPHCHCRLPIDFGLIPTVKVSMLGGRASGKTAFLIAMIQQLNDQLSAKNLGSITLLPESEAYMRPQIEFYQQSGGNTMPTPNQRLFPIVFRYQNATGTQKTSCFVVIYDIAGEALGDEDITPLGNHKGIREATIFLLVIDPNQFNQGAYHQMAQQKKAQQENTGQRFAPEGKQHDYYPKDIPTFIQTDLTKCATVTDQVRHVITVLTKMDYPLYFNHELFGEHSKCIVKNRLGSAHNEAVHLDVLNRIDFELNQIYRVKQKNIDIKTQIRNVFNDKHKKLYPNEPDVDVSLLGVSTYTQQLNSNTNEIEYVNNGSPNEPKHRIIEPFLKILVLAGMIQTKNKRAAQEQPPEKPRKGRRKRAKSVT